MPDRQRPPAWTAPAVAVLTLLWLACLLAVAYQVFVVGMEQWSNRYGGSPTWAEAEGPRRKELFLVQWGSILLLAGPTLIAITAAIGRRYWAAGVYGFITVLLCYPGTLTIHDAYRKLNPPAPWPAPTYACQEHSGEGGNSCPGG